MEAVRTGKKKSKAYGYNYASLGDMAAQGVDIPKMSTITDYTTMKEYLAYWDEDLKTWVRGAEIVVPENIVNAQGKNKMNASQLYGSALTYARRYTTSMALGIADQDDKNIEAQEGDTIQPKPLATEDQVKLLYENGSPQWVADVEKRFNISSLKELTREQADGFIRKMNARKNNGTD